MKQNLPTVKHNSNIGIHLFILLLINIILFTFVNLYDHDLFSIALTAVICYLTFYISWFRQDRNFINYYTIFLTLTFFFYFGQFFLYLIGFPLESGRSILDNLLPHDKIIETGVFLINFMLILHIGVMASTTGILRFRKPPEEPPTQPTTIEAILTKRMQLVASVLFLGSIVPSVIIMIRNIQITLTAGYVAIFQSAHYTLGGFDNLLRFISLLTIPSLIMMLVSFRGNKTAVRWISFIVLIYLGLYFLSGTRINGVFLIITIVLVRHYWYQKIDLKMTVILGLIGIVGLTIISSISEIRNISTLSTNTGNLIAQTLANVFARNPVFTLMEEAGYTFLTTATVLTYSPAVVPHYLGKSYLNSFLILFPNLFWDVHPAGGINTDIVFKGFLSSYGGIGSSFIAECYWNFGYYSLLGALLFGFLIGFLTKSISKFGESYHTPKFYLAIYVAYITFFYVRVDTVGFWRNYFYYGIAPVLLAIILSKIRTKRVVVRGT